MVDFGIVLLNSNVMLFIMNNEGVSCLFVLNKLIEGLFFEYYELIEILIGMNLFYFNVVLNLMVCILESDKDCFGDVS